MEESSRVHKAIGCSSEIVYPRRPREKHAKKMYNGMFQSPGACVCVCVLRTYMGVCLGKREKNDLSSVRISRCRREAWGRLPMYRGISLTHSRNVQDALYY